LSTAGPHEANAVLVWHPGEFRDSAPPTEVSAASCLRSTTAGSRAVVYRTTADQGIAGVFDFLSDAHRHPDMGWAGYGVLHLLDTPISRHTLLADEHLRPCSHTSKAAASRPRIVGPECALGEGQCAFGERLACRYWPRSPR
jgi:hypothetical protein